MSLHCGHHERNLVADDDGTTCCERCEYEARLEDCGIPLTFSALMGNQMEEIRDLKAKIEELKRRYEGPSIDKLPF